MSERIVCRCPYAECDGKIPVSKNIPAGFYDCICHAVRVRLSWATSANFKPVPFLSLATEAEIAAHEKEQKRLARKAKRAASKKEPPQRRIASDAKVTFPLLVFVLEMRHAQAGRRN